MVKNLPASAADIREVGSVPKLERSLGGTHGNPLQYSCLKDPMERSLEGYCPKGHKESDTSEVTWLARRQT